MSETGKEKSIWATVAVLLTASAFAMTPGGTQKKFIGLCFDTMFNTPSNILAHADRLDEVHWLDGLAISLKDVVIPVEGGGVVTTETQRVMSRGHEWTRESIAGQLPIFRELVKHDSMRDSLLLVWITPAGKQNRIAWNDDEEWARFARNMGNLAWFAKKAGLKGLMIDPEEYSSAGQYRYKSCDAPSHAECAKLARRRGREVFSAVFREYPDILILSLWGFEIDVRYFTDRRQTDPVQISKDFGRMLPEFFNGMFDAMPPKARFADGSEHYNLTAKRNLWWKGGVAQFIGARAFVAQENWTKYRAQLSISNAHYLDMHRMYCKPYGWYHGPVDGSRLEHLRINLVQSLETADEYVWIYAEQGRLIDWDSAPTRHQNPKLTPWEEHIPGLTETMLLAKDPDKLMRMRKDERRRAGTLKNLVSDHPSFPAVLTLEKGESPRRMDVPGKVSVTVKSGELYGVGVSMRADYFTGRPSFRVKWRSKLGDLPLANEREFSMKGSRENGVWRKGEMLVRVPRDADELVLGISAEVNPGESFIFDKPEIYKLGEPLPKWETEKGGERR